MSEGAAALAGWIPIFLNDAMLALISLAGVVVREKLDAIALWIGVMLSRAAKAVDRERVAISVHRFAGARDGLLEGRWRRGLGGSMNAGFDVLTLTFWFAATGYSTGPLMLIAGYGIPSCPASPYLDRRA